MFPGRSISPWKGNLPGGPEDPCLPIHYFCNFIDEIFLSNINDQINLHAVQCDSTWNGTIYRMVSLEQKHTGKQKSEHQ
jgi:hypothetical protein